MKMLTAVSVKEKQGAGLSYSNHNLWRHDAPSHLTFERNDGIRTGYAPETESRTWSSRVYCDGDIPSLYMSVCLSLLLNGLLKISEKIWSRQGFSFTLCSHFSSAIHIPFTFYSQNAPTSISIMGLGGVKEWKKKLLCRTFFRRYSASAGRFRPSFSLLDRLFPVTLRAKRTAMQTPRHTSMRGKPLHSVANTVNWYCRQS